MLQVTLEVVSMDSAALPVARSCRFEGDGGTIGRDEGNTFVLADKHRRVSRLHAAVAFPLGIPTITNASTSLPITISDVPLDCGRTSPLAKGDVLEIGPYVLRVQSASVSELDLSAPTMPTIPLISQFGPSPQLPGSVAAGVSDSFQNLLVQSGPPSLAIPNRPVVELKNALAQTTKLDTASSVSAMPFSGKPVDDPLAGLFDAPVKHEGKHLGEVSGMSVDPLSAMGFGSGVLPDTYETNSVQSNVLASSIIPEDFNPFDLPSRTTRNTADPLTSMLGGNIANSGPAGNRGEPSIDSLFSSSGPSTIEGILNQPGGASSSQPGYDLLFTKPADSDPFAMFGDFSSQETGQLQPVRDNLAEISGAFQPPRAFTANDPSNLKPDPFLSIPKAPPQSSTIPSSGVDALTQAFLNGAGLPVSALPGGLTPEIMSLVGSILRSATSGAVDMLAARTATKLEVQANVTIISAQGNNPLKFLPNGETALMQLLSKRMPGFMRADVAMRDAFEDLRAHEVGVIAGTRAALAEVLGKFDPAILGERLARGSFVESILPSIRKTKLWDIYLERYAQIRREAEDDFQSIFGRAFVHAYERETARMKSRVAESGVK